MTQVLLGAPSRPVVTEGGVRRVAVTGVGAVTALGADAETTFARLINGERQFGPLADSAGSILADVVVAEVAVLEPEEVCGRNGALGWPRRDLFALRAAREAMASAGMIGGAVGLAIGSTTGPVVGLERVRAEELSGNALTRAHFSHHDLASTARRLRSALGGVTRDTTLCSACSSGAVAIGLGMEWIRSGSAEAVLVGGVDALCQLTLVGFGALGAMSGAACRPFDEARDGMTLGEGAGFLLLESESVARARGAKILAWLGGWSSASESFHLTQPEPTGQASARLVRRACEDARLLPSGIDYVNAHGTGTRVNDAAEARALAEVFGERLASVWVSSNKGQLGHTLGAAGAIEAVMTVLSLARGVVPPTGGLREPAAECAGLLHVLDQGRSARLRAAVSTSYGFGGVGVALVFEAVSEAVVAERPTASPQASKVALRRTPRILAVRQVTGGGVNPDGTAWDPLARLDPLRSRRFNRLTAMTTWGVEEVLGKVGCEREDVGLAMGFAYGNVERTVAFVDRVASRGRRMASPAEFPHILPSSVTGNASLYAHLTGPVLGVCDVEGCVEQAFMVGLDLIQARRARAMVVGAVVVRDSVLDVRRPGELPEDGEAGVWMVLGWDDGAPTAGCVECPVSVVWCWQAVLGEQPWVLPSCLAADAEVVLVAGSENVLVPLLGQAGLADVPRSVTEGGPKTMAGGRALARGVALVAEGKRRDVLVMTLGQGCLFAVLLRCGEGEP